MTALGDPGTHERALLRDSVRGLLVEHWPVAHAVERQADEGALAAIWRALAALGLTSLGTDPEEGGLAETLVAIEELGRAACPAPLADAVLANLALRSLRRSKRAADDLLAALHTGDARVAFVFGALEAEGCAVRLERSRLSGTLRFIDGGACATHVLVALDSNLAVVTRRGDGVSVEPTRALGFHGLAQMTLRECVAEVLDVDGANIGDWTQLRRLCLLARAQGAARRAFELLVDYAKVRQQFGKPIGSFQAIQHKLADCFIQLEGVRLLLGHAAIEHDRGRPDWRYFAAAALAFGSRALRQVSLETHHGFGAVGYAEEHEAPRHFRRVHLDTIAIGSAHPARAALAARFLDAPPDGEDASLPRFDLGPAGNAFREQVGQWLAQHWSGERKAEFDARAFHDREFDASFARDLGSTGWMGLSWPHAHGGQARAPIEQIAFMEEMEHAEAPRAGAAIQANALMLFGTPAQQRKYLPEILRGEAMHGMGYSEPDAGSDLASLKTLAVRDGNEWVINGQKIWTTTWWGKYMFLAARTSRDARPAHAGISMFIVPMDTPGIVVRPAATMYDGTFANIFYDNVRVPADALLGEENGGWKVLTSALATERGLVGGGIVLKVAHAFECLCAELRAARLGARSTSADALVRDRIGELAAEIEVGRQLMLHCAELAGAGATPPEYGAISKVFSGELMERFGETALELLGMRGTLSQGASGAVQNGRFEQGLRHSLMWVISIGTNEIQRSLIAQRGLGLPR
jgi:alkylation response protein AidB-like acyl-CoA dehydrogenase